MKYICWSLLFLLFFACKTKQEQSDYIPPMPDSVSYAVVLKALSESIENTPSAVNLYQRARLYMNLGQLQNALSDINLAIDKDNSQPKFYLLRATIHHGRKSTNQALSDAFKAEQLQLNDQELFILLGELFYQKKNYAKSLQNLEKALKISPFSERAWYWRANSTLADQNIRQGIEFYKVSLRHNPEFTAAHHQLASVYNQIQNFDTARYYALEGIRIKPTQGDLYFQLAETYKFTERLDTAKTLYLKAVEKDAGLYAAYFELGLLEFRAKNYLQTITYFEKIEKNKKEFTGYDELLARSYDLTGQFEKSYKQYVYVLNQSEVSMQSIERYGQLKNYFQALKYQAYLDSLQNLYPQRFIRPTPKIEKIEPIKPIEIRK
ncbi:MAG: tetratricopeptide repeat protein [Verrucomicrobia bacterium]|nr:tetratricopeptide repeat protein [Cytophagales bacterium]